MPSQSGSPPRIRRRGLCYLGGTYGWPENLARLMASSRASSLPQGSSVRHRSSVGASLLAMLLNSALQQSF
ncbi:hypothetical protein C1X61_20875 [Pseudomonas sp. FW215-T2]|nr:hypothetical protein C1X61_20875 [Pseudomonas sp. FW215-T2]PNA10964.1 hypothetical protein C1X62_16900 [Pseudomonas sp. FW215-R3]PNB36819.1 hypothetical protein C1X63_16040 [Pseudomonas sp. FW305-131]